MMLFRASSSAVDEEDFQTAGELTKGSHTGPVSLACAILGVAVVYVMVLDWRFPYIHQVPVFDLDYITTVTMMWARNWWIETPWKMFFSMPYAPLSVEMPTPDLRVAMYQSWPPGAVLPVYLTAKLTGTEPNITMINWLNVAGHGLIALFLSLSAYLFANILRRPKVEGVALAIVAACLVLLPRGPVFFFSQVYTFDTHIVVYYALMIFVMTLELGASDRSSEKWFYRLQIAIFAWGLFVDWLFYFVYAVWFALRLLGARTGYGRAIGRGQAAALTVFPLATFSVFLTWRILTPGSIAAKNGLVASLQELVWKFLYRTGGTDDHPVTAAAFFGPFYEAHRYWYWNATPILIGGGFILCLVLFAALFLMSRTGSEERRTYFGAFSIFLLSIIPAYAQMIVFKQHSAIHPWSIAKVVVPLAMVSGVFLPLLTISVLERWQAERKLPWRGAWRTAGTIGVLAFAFWIGASAWPPRNPYLLGRVNPAAPVPWLTIHENTSYHDVVFSPEFETAPFGIEAAVAGKLVYQAGSFALIDRKVEEICEPFNVVVVRKSPDAEEMFDGRTPDRVVRSGGLTLMWFQNYQGAAKGCARS